MDIFGHCLVVVVFDEDLRLANKGCRHQMFIFFCITFHFQIIFWEFFFQEYWIFVRRM